MDFSRYSLTLRAVFWLCSKLSWLPDKVIANSEVGLNVHQAAGYFPKNMRVIHNGIDTDTFKPSSIDRATVRRELGIPLDARVIFHVARVDPMKNHLGLLRAFSKTKTLWLVLLGKGTLDLPKQDRVLALGQRSDISNILQTGDCIISSSDFGEGFSNALAEGMACGLVPIATNVGDSAIIVSDTGWLVEPYENVELQSAILAFEALDDIELLERKRQAWRHINENFKIEKMTQEYDYLYKDLRISPILDVNSR